MDTISHGLIYTLFLTDIFIPCFSQINLFRVVVVSPAFGVDTNQKKKHGYHRLDTDLSFTDLFFDIIELMILGFGFDLFGFASAGALPFLAVSQLLLHISTTAPT